MGDVDVVSPRLEPKITRPSKRGFDNLGATINNNLGFGMGRTGRCVFDCKLNFQFKARD
jgi:hypothetical protein